MSLTWWVTNQIKPDDAINRSMVIIFKPRYFGKNTVDPDRENRSVVFVFSVIFSVIAVILVKV